jgi:hypothetical protein
MPSGRFINERGSLWTQPQQTYDISRFLFWVHNAGIAVVPMVAVYLPLVDHKYPCLGGDLIMGPSVDPQRDCCCSIILALKRPKTHLNCLAASGYATFWDLQWTWTPHYLLLQIP